MSEDFETLTCRYCGMDVDTDDAVDVDTPVGPVSLCPHCHVDVFITEQPSPTADHD